jgi:ATPase subunit of ABC transporter with duplicated ATPase domains
MSILQASGLALRFAQEQPLFADVHFEINPGDRIALVGPNGAGKSSLLRLLSAELEPDAGHIVRRRGLAISVFSQHLPLAEGESMADWLAEPGLARVLHGLGFDGDAIWSPLAFLSAGQRSRALLARALTQPAGLLLLDEPTNHLDAAARAWLERELLRHHHTCLFVSHDESFLSAVATRVFELRRGRFRAFGGDWHLFQQESAAAEARDWSAYTAEQKHIAALERAAARRDTLAAKVAATPPGARYSKDFYGRKAAQVARTGRLLRERFAPEARVEKPWEDQPFPRLHFAACARSGDVPLRLRNLSLGYGGKPVLEGLDAAIRRGERWAIRGPNGAGKSTLLRAIMGQLPPLTGAIELAPNVHPGYFAQEAEMLRPADSPLHACLRLSNDRTWIRTLLACLKLPRHLAETPIHRLSLGERSKTALAQLLVSGANLLLLDEPTNHLEIEARHALQETLHQFPGTILLVSHDDAFTASIATNHLEIAV